MLRIKLPAVGPSNFINTSGATTHEKKIIDPKIVATEIKPMTMSTSDISIPYKKNSQQSPIFLLFEQPNSYKYEVPRFRKY